MWKRIHTIFFRSLHDSSAIMSMVFLLILSLGLMLGDGKQGLIEVFAAIGIVFLWSLRLYLIGEKPRTIPPLLQWGFGIVTFFALISLVGSKDIGYSISLS